MKIAGVVFIGVLITALIVYTGKNNKDSSTKQEIVSSPTTSSSVSQNREGGDEMTNQELIIEDLTVGNGTEAIEGKKVTVHYTGRLTDGTKFDSSIDRGTPFTFNLGAGEVIQGWDKGVVGMKTQGKRKLTIPSQLAYGESGAGNVIPPNATLVFEIELLKVE